MAGGPADIAWAWGNKLERNRHLLAIWQTRFLLEFDYLAMDNAFQRSRHWICALYQPVVVVSWCSQIWKIGRFALVGKKLVVSGLM
jgi:hypothetical protein